MINFFDPASDKSSDLGTPARDSEVQVSLSIGIAGYSPALADTTAWLNAADAALYQAKHQGRNCIVLADTPPAEALVAQPG